MLPQRRCSECGRALTPAPARWDGEDTTVGYHPCQCDEARREDAERQYDAVAERARQARVRRPRCYRRDKLESDACAKACMLATNGRTHPDATRTLCGEVTPP